MTCPAMSKTILLYELSEQAALKKQLEALGLEAREVPRAQYSLPLGVILGVRKAGKLPPPYTGDGLKQPMLVMHGLSSAEVDGVLAALKALGLHIPLKALTTPSNLKWPATQLYGHLMMESAMQARRRRGR